MRVFEERSTLVVPVFITRELDSYWRPGRFVYHAVGIEWHNYGGTNILGIQTGRLGRWRCRRPAPRPANWHPSIARSDDNGTAVNVLGVFEAHCHRKRALPSTWWQRCENGSAVSRTRPHDQRLGIVAAL